MLVRCRGLGSKSPSNSHLGELKNVKEDNKVFIDQGVWKAEVATKVNQD